MYENYLVEKKCAKNCFILCRLPPPKIWREIAGHISGIWWEQDVSKKNFLGGMQKTSAKN